MELVAGVDVATAGVRALVTDAAGRERARAHRPIPAPSSPRPGWWEQSAQAWWPAVAEALAEVTDRLGGERQAVTAVSVCATSGTVVALDREGEPVAPALAYADQRAVSQSAVAQDAAAARWAKLGLGIQPSFGLPKWGWLCAQPGVAAATARLAHASDVVVCRLVGTLPPTDWSHALKSGYDPGREEWATEALDALGIAPELLPDVAPPTRPAGRVTGDAALATGLPEGCLVRLGMTDSCAAQLAAGAGTPGQFVSVLGSTLVLKGTAEEPVCDPDGAVYSHRHPNGWWLPGGASSTGAGALTAGFPRRALAALDERAARRGPARSVVYALPGRGERFPFVAPDAEGFVLGQPRDEVDRYRAVLEGVAFVERLGYERLARLGATVTPPLAVTGGGSASPVWNRIRATTLGMALDAKPSATTALGACMLAAAGTLHPDLATATAAMAVTGERSEPVEREREALAHSYARFLDALAARGWITPQGVS
ncbi:MAG TPA: FGGY family carbohydrate kinase [Egibacteraceae bacterium]|nr:FGGY family carbohydrate kinase [Egibacteraceae bacterium]